MTHEEEMREALRLVAAKIAALGGDPGVPPEFYEGVNLLDEMGGYYDGQEEKEADEWAEEQQDIDDYSPGDRPSYHEADVDDPAYDDFAGEPDHVRGDA